MLKPSGGTSPFLLEQSGFFSDPIKVDQGVTQGDTDSPMIFNLIIDAVLQKVQEEEPM